MIAPLVLAAATLFGTLSGTLPAPGVVWIEDSSKPPPTRGAMITQTDRAFVPALAVVTVGSTVRFPNQDDVDHSVYSSSEADPFDLGIYEPGPGKDVVFEHPGVIEIRCHIHRRMKATLLVVDGPFARVETAGGKWVLDHVRKGPQKLHVWNAETGETTTQNVVVH